MKHTGKKDWDTIIRAIAQEMEQFSNAEQAFYSAFLEWIKEALQQTNIIVVEGNQ